MSKSERFSRGAAELVSAARGLIERVRRNRQLMWWIRWAGRWVIVILALILYTLVVGRTVQKKALATYAGWLEDYKAEQEALLLEAPQDPYEAQLNAEAEELARVLYGVRDNDTDDLRTYCWCVFNRVDNDAFPSALADVIAQPEQWMRYHQTNPVLEPLYQVAREELDRWHTESHRPCAADYVFMTWSASDICLRDNWQAGSGTHYWRWGQ